MHIYGKKLKKISLFGTKRPITLKLGTQYRLIDYYSGDRTYGYRKCTWCAHGVHTICEWLRVNECTCGVHHVHRDVTLSSVSTVPNLFKWWYCMTLTYFTAKPYLFPYVFVWEKGKKIFDIFVHNIKVEGCRQSNEYMKHYEYQRSRSFIDLHPRSLRFNFFKLLFSRNPLADWSQISCGASMG